MTFHSKKYPQLNDVEWLYQKYIVENQSTLDICKLLNIKAPNSVRQALLGAGIQVRTPSEGLRVNNDKLIIDLDVLNGGLLGDASLSKFNKKSEKSIPFFHKTNKYLDHIELVAKSFYVESYKEHVREKHCKLNGKVFHYWFLKTGADEQFIKHYDKWYPESNNHVKVVPTDLVLTPKSILHWFMDDGCAYRRYRSEFKKKTNEIVITFASESFTKEENEYLVGELNRFSLNAKITPYCLGTGWRIRIPQTKNLDFLSLIGDPPLESMAYKWKYPEKQYEKCLRKDSLSLR
jgi:hypothetical protein